ncbi:MAG: type II secretion system protein [Rhodocyclaceae bacterium]|nr:type II secretion system protein [Rhodocyclaceae bacterium]
MRHTRGFTYIEMLVALALVALVAALAAPTVQQARRREDERTLRVALREIRSAIDAYKRASEEGRITLETGESGYPRRLADLVTGVADASKPDEPRIVFLRRLPPDPLFRPGLLGGSESVGDLARGRVPPEQTWGLRSFTSPPDAPAPGRDVFDVYSLNPGLALDGSRYRDW